jgi:glycosyltransferase involved in cell wall biosynthesis
VLGVPVICHVHEAEGSAPRILRRLLALPVRWATHVVVNSEFSAGCLQDAAPGLANRTTVVPNAVPGPGVQSPMPEKAHDPLRLGYIGRLSPRKGVDVVIAAMAALRDQGCPTSLTIVGAVFPGYEWYEAELRDQVSSLGLDASVTFRGFVPDVWPVLETLDVVAVPSRYDEPFGNTAVEAVLASRPVVVSATSGLIEAVRGYRLALPVPPGDAAELAAAVLRAKRTWGTLRAAAESDFALATRRHSAAAYGARIVLVVDTIVGRRSAQEESAQRRGAARRKMPQVASSGASHHEQGRDAQWA